MPKLDIVLFALNLAERDELGTSLFVRRANGALLHLFEHVVGEGDGFLRGHGGASFEYTLVSSAGLKRQSACVEPPVKAEAPRSGVEPWREP